MTHIIETLGRYRIAKRFLCCLGILTLTVVCYCGYLRASGNFHAVIPGEAYRSAQPSAAQLKYYAARYGIKTIINLRGTSEDAAWYRAEASTAGALGLRLVDFKMSATKTVTPETATQLAEIMRTAEKPILIHCKAGADRSGIASAIYSHMVAGRGEDVSERQLSLYFGHIGIPFLSPTYAMDDSWERIEKETAQRG